MFKKISINPHAIDYVAAIIVVLIQVLIIYFMNDYSKFIFNFIEATFGTVRFGFIIPLVAVITYSLYFGNSKLSFIVGFLSTITPQVYFIFFSGGLDFVLKFPQSFIAMFVLGVIFGLIGILVSIFKKNADVSTRVLMHAALLMSILGIPAVFRGLGLDIGVSLVFLLVFNTALILGLLLSYLTLHDVKKAFVFTFSALIMTFLIILITPLYSIFVYHIPLIGYPFIGIIIAAMLGVILKVYVYYQTDKIRS